MRDATSALRECCVIPAVNADSLYVESFGSEPDNGDSTAEFATGNEDTAMKFCEYELHPLPSAKRIKVVKKLYRSAARVDSVVRDALKSKLALLIRSFWISTVGDGVNNPPTVFMDSYHRNTSAQDVSTGNTTTVIKAYNLIECKCSRELRPRNAKCVFHTDAVKTIDKLKDGNVNYLWCAGPAAD